MWHVERFIPDICPRQGCYTPFIQNSSEGFLLNLHWKIDSTDITAKVRESIECVGLYTDTIICGKCRNVTLIVKLEERVCDTREEAEELLRIGFKNIQEIHLQTLEPDKIPRIIRYLPHQVSSEEFGKKRARRILPTPGEAQQLLRELVGKKY